MAVPAKPRSTFGDQLRAQLDRHQSIRSVRRLSQVMADGRPGGAETYRRLLHKWVAGETKPTEASRYMVAAALGVDADTAFPDDDDDEEPSMRGAIRSLLLRGLEASDRERLERLWADRDRRMARV